MRVRKSVPMLAAAATLLASTTPAYAFDSQAPAGGSLPPAQVAVGHPAGSSDVGLELAAGGVLIAGGALGAVQLRRRSTRTVPNTRVASRS
jgi:hypothetical protein